MMRGFYYNQNLAGGSMLSEVFRIIACIMMISFILLLITIVVILIIKEMKRRNAAQSAVTKPNFNPPSTTSLEILNTRLAKGDITIEEYQQIKTELMRL